MNGDCTAGADLGRFILWMMVVFGTAAAIVAMAYVMPRPEADLAALASLSPAAGAPYDITPAQDMRDVKAPRLPDIRGDTVDAVRAALPSVSAGTVGVREVGDLALGIRRDIHLFAERQQRYNPQAIVIETGTYDLPALLDAVKNPALLARGKDGDYRLRAPLMIAKGAGLVIGDRARLFLDRGDGALIANFGRLDIVGAQVAGWDYAKGGPASFTDHGDFRPYIVSLCGSAMNLAGSRFAHLGYFDTKSYGITYTSCDDIIYGTEDHTGASGCVIGNRFDDMYYGFYSFESGGIRVVGNQYIDNVVYGIDPHDRSKNLIIAKNIVRGAKQKHGIILSRDVSDSFIFDNISEGNAGAGLILDRASRHNVVANNILRGNGGDGLAFYESGDNLSYGNSLSDNAGSGLRIRNSQGIVSRGDVISGNQKGGVQAYAIDLIAAGAQRNVSIDPYDQVAGADIAMAEITGNRKADFTLRDVNDIRIGPVKRFNAPPKFIAGDIEIKDMPEGGVAIRRAD